MQIDCVWPAFSSKRTSVQQSPRLCDFFRALVHCDRRCHCQAPWPVVTAMISSAVYVLACCHLGNSHQEAHLAVATLLACSGVLLAPPPPPPPLGGKGAAANKKAKGD